MHTKSGYRLALILALAVALIATAACSSAPATQVAPGTAGKPAPASSGGGEKAAASLAGANGPAAPEGGSGNDTLPGALAGEKATIYPGVAYIDDVGYLHIYGEVENHTDQWLSGWVTVKLFDQDGKELMATTVLGEGDQAGNVVPFAVAPGGRAPIDYLRAVDKIDGEFDHYEFVAPAAGEWNVVAVRATGEIGDVATTRNPDSLYIVGAFTAGGEGDCVDPTVVVAAYDANGLIVRLKSVGVKATEESMDVLDSLKPGEQAVFRTSFDGEGIDGLIKDLKTFPGCQPEGWYDW